MRFGRGKLDCADPRNYPTVVSRLTIEIASDLEPLIKREARKAGVDPVTYTEHLLRSALPAPDSPPPALTPAESALLKEIDTGLSAEESIRYKELVEIRRQETIDQAELSELKEITGRLEEFQARRMECISELARLRGVSVAELMRSLQVRSPDVL